MSSILDSRDQRLLALLSENARASTAELARILKLSRSTVQDRINRLENRGVIAGYTVRLDHGHAVRQVWAQVMIKAEQRSQDQVISSIRKIESVRALHTTTGEFDLIARVTAATTEVLDGVLDAIGRLPGIERTKTSILLSKKFER